MDNKELLDAIRGIVKEEVEPLKTDIKGIKSTQEEHSKELKSLNSKVDRIEEKLGITYDEVARIREDTTDIKNSVEILEQNVDFVESATLKNLIDIRQIKNNKKQA